MTAVLADTSFFVAYLNPKREDCHKLAVEWMTAASELIVTSDWVLAELWNFLAEGGSALISRSGAKPPSADKRFEIVPADRESFMDAELVRATAGPTSCPLRIAFRFD